MFFTSVLYAAIFTWLPCQVDSLLPLTLLYVWHLAEILVAQKFALPGNGWQVVLTAMRRISIPRMIIVNLIGGLGNQMFQYACGRAQGRTRHGS